ncbi:MAG: hypothetical protein IT459_03440 [Planctomycetes bacterium]|nr:hypothetical protein [Planctomycetota bacterium]
MQRRDHERAPASLATHSREPATIGSLAMRAHGQQRTSAGKIAQIAQGTSGPHRLHQCWVVQCFPSNPQQGVSVMAAKKKAKKKAAKKAGKKKK